MQSNLDALARLAAPGGTRDLDAMQKQAVDLGDLAQKKQQEQAEAEAAAMQAAVHQAQRWDRAMNRAFKGIVSRPARHRMLNEIAREAEKGASR